MSLFIKRVDKSNQYDVFLNNGWAEWSRIRRNHWGVSVVAGKKLPREALRQLNDLLINRA